MSRSSSSACASKTVLKEFHSSSYRVRSAGYEVAGKLVRHLAMLGMCDRDQCAGRSQGRVVEVVFYAKVDVEFDQHLIEMGLPFGRAYRCLADCPAQPLENLVVFFQHVVGVHFAAPLPNAARMRPIAAYFDDPVDQPGLVARQRSRCWAA